MLFSIPSCYIVLGNDIEPDPVTKNKQFNFSFEANVVQSLK